MKLFYVAIFLVVASLPVGFIGIYAAWDRTPPQYRLLQLDQIMHTGGMVYLAMVAGSVLLFLVWLSLPLNRRDYRV